MGMGDIEMCRMRGFVVLVFLLAPLVCRPGVAAEESAARPNVVLLMADDLGWGDPRCFNPQSPIHTPHLDAMAAAGMKFTRFYAAAPVCSPTRGSCLTGRHPYRYGVYQANVGHLPQGEQTLAELLKGAGYTTGHFGKWHLGTLTQVVRDSNRGGRDLAAFSPPQDHGFDYCFSTEAKVPTWDPMWQPGEDAPPTGWSAIEDLRTAVRYNTRYWDERGRVVEEQLLGDDSRVIMDRAIDFIERSVQAEVPFLAVIWFHAPHLPVVTGPQYAAKYSQYDAYHQNYYGCVTALDDQIGRLRATLEGAGVAQHTLVWFCSDNGPEGDGKNSPGSAAHWRGRKRSLYEGGIRVPGILVWPGHVPAGSVSDFPVVTSDYLPTLADILGTGRTDGRPLDGISLLPLLEGHVTQRDKPIGFCSAKQRAWITQRYKLFSRDAGTTWELYDLLEDPSETEDLATRQPERVAEMEQTYLQWRRSCRSSDQGADYRQLP
jgi:arylsulfatase A-like enzyme